MVNGNCQCGMGVKVMHLFYMLLRRKEKGIGDSTRIAVVALCITVYAFIGV